MFTGIDLAPYFERLQRANTMRSYGRIQKAVGIVIESQGPPCSVGEVCEVVKGDPDALDPGELFNVLRRTSRTSIVQSRLEKLIDSLAHEDSDVYVIGRVGNGIRASEAVAAALWAFVRYAKTPEECVVRAVNFGGDTDTIGAMAGALAGALHGTSWIPSRWYDNMENGQHGRDEIVEVARGLSRLDIS